MTSERSNERRVVVGPDPDSVIHRLAKKLVTKLAKLSGKDDAVVHVSLTGGGAGISVLRAIAAHPDRDSVRWDRIHFWWGDERYVPADDAERNELQAREALIDALDVPADHIHAMAASDSGLSVEDGALAYERALAEFPSVNAQGDTQPWPSFDICLLGVGPDAHIASLFPDRAEITITDRSAVPVFDAPKPPPVRITLTRPVINSSQRLWLVLTGEEKASALGLALAGASYASVPAAGAKGRRHTTFFVDRAAAAQVPEELIDPA